MDPASDVVVLLAHDLRVEDARGGVQRVHRGIDAQFGQLPRQHGGRVQVREGRGRRRVGEVVGRHVDGLHRGDRALLGGGDALLELAHLRAEGRLVAHGRRHAAQQSRHLGASLGEAEDVVDEEEHVLSFLVAEVLGHGQARQADAQARAGWLVHLPVHEGGLVDDAGLAHLEVEVVAFAGPLSHAGKDREPAMVGRDVVDQLHDDDGLAHAGAAEEAHLPALGVRLEQVHDLDAGLQHLGLCLLIQ